MEQVFWYKIDGLVEYGTNRGGSPFSTFLDFHLVEIQNQSCLHDSNNLATTKQTLFYELDIQRWSSSTRLRNVNPKKRGLLLFLSRSSKLASIAQIDRLQILQFLQPNLHLVSIDF